MSTISSSLVLRQKALIENPSPRVPICLVLDASGSMNTAAGGEIQNVTRLDELNRGLVQFIRELMSDDNAKQSAEICVVTFADEANLVRDFSPLSTEHETTQVTSAGGGTSLGKGVKLALQYLDKRKDEYQKAGVEYYQPWLVVITDGTPTDQSHVDAAIDITQRVQAKKLSVFPIVVGNISDTSELARISPARPPIHLKGAKFCEFFEWLSKSVSRVSSSIPGETVPLDKKGIDAWGNL